MHNHATISWLSDRALRIASRECPSQDQSIARAWAMASALRAATIDGVEDLTLAYAGVQVRVTERIAMDPHAAADVERRVRDVCDRAGAGETVRAQGKEPTSRLTIDIPVCYDPDLGLDLEWVARETRLSIDDLIALHTRAAYRVHFFGFLPGFAYMGSVPEPLRVPRHPSPRTRVPAGSVAIAGAQAGIYPSDTPGGWRILGRTPLAIFEPSRARASLLEPGDRVRFLRIDRARFDALAREHRP